MHPIWQDAYDTACKALEPYSSDAVRENILRDYRDNVIKGYKERLIGNVRGLTASQDRSIEEMPLVLKEIQNEISTMLIMDREKQAKKFKKKEEQFKFLK